MNTASEQQIMQQHGITAEEKIIYCYKSYKYDDLQQAINFAVFQQAKLEKDKR